MTTDNENFEPLTAQEAEAASVQPEPQERDHGEAILPVPSHAPEHLPNHELGKPAKVWTYHDADGNDLFHVCRFITADGKKEDRPLTFRRFKDGSERWCWRGVPAPRPLYDLDCLAKHKTKKILVCEGEKAADAAGKIFPEFVATTSPNGSQSPDKADWKPLAGRTVVIWPDNDEAGRKYAQAVAQFALQAGALSVAIVAVPTEFPEKWDLADELPEGFTKKDLERLIAEAQPAALPPDPLDGLVERAAHDPGEAFRSEVVQALAKLWLNDRPAYESLRVRLKKGGLRVGELEKLVRQEIGDGTDSDNGEDTQSQTDILLAIASAADLFHTPDGSAYADVDVDGHRETYHVRQRGFSLWLIRVYHETTEKAPNAESLNAAINTIEAKALFKGDERDVHIRTGREGGKIYIDLCDAKWRAVEVDPDGWRVIDSPPIRFRRTSSMLPLPVPQKGGSIDLLRNFINVKNETDFVLCVSWKLAALSGASEYALLGLSGEQAAAKSTTSFILKSVVDPNSAPLRSLPKEEDNLFISANNGLVMAFDNVSSISPVIADALCRIATGGGHSKRQLYSDMDEIIINVARPVLVNGISDLFVRPDLADRAVIVNLQAIPEDKRKSKEELLAEFETAQPHIFGALLDGLSHGLKTLPHIHFDRLPRMADFARLATACEEAYWPKGAFMKAYDQNRDNVIDVVFEANPVATAVISLMEGKEKWEGTASLLLDCCEPLAEDAVIRGRAWPKTPKGMSDALTRATPILRHKGIEVSRERDSDKKRTRLISLSWLPEKDQKSKSEPSGQSAKPVPKTDVSDAPDDEKENFDDWRPGMPM